MNPGGSHVRIASVNYRYSVRSEFVIEDLSLTIEPGQRVALIGGSGCGKSTLLKLMSGLALPSSGNIHIDGAHVRTPRPVWNMMFQKPSLYPWMSVKQNASLGMLIAGERRLVKDRVPDLLEMVGLTQFADTNVQRLSGGQQQRVALARSLASQPELLMLDEPFAALDEVTRNALQNDVMRISDQFGMTMVVVTHDIDEAIKMSNRILVMSANKGKVLADLSNEPTEDDESRIRELKSQMRRHLKTDMGKTSGGLTTDEHVEPRVYSMN